ncbi:MAG: hypothetical protein WBL27_10690 [Salinimicrobium sp.]
METLTLARIIHVLSIVLWIGGVSMVTTVIIPAVKRLKSKEEQIETFERLEGRFSLQAKITTLLAAITGFYMLYRYNAWDRLLEIKFWWLHAMILVWLLFSIVLFILEPLLLHRLFRKYAEENPERTFRIIHRAHWFLLLLSLLTIFGAVAGSHGWYLF